MSRASALVACALLSGAGCVCTPLWKVCGPVNGVACPTEADEIAAGLRTAEDLWLEKGDCAGGPSVGTTSSGTWVNPGAPDFCGEEFFFNRAGELSATRRCCETDCSDFGLGPQLTRGPVTRDLCREALPRLLLRGVRLKPYSVEAVWQPDGVLVPRVEGEWRLPFGSWVAGLAGDAGQLSFSIAGDPDGGLLITDAHVGTTPWTPLFAYRYQVTEKGTFRRVELPLWLERADGGSASKAVDGQR